MAKNTVTKARKGNRTANEFIQNLTRKHKRHLPAPASPEVDVLER